MVRRPVSYWSRQAVWYLCFGWLMVMAMPARADTTDATDNGGQGGATSAGGQAQGDQGSQTQGDQGNQAEGSEGEQTQGGQSDEAAQGQGQQAQPGEQGTTTGTSGASEGKARPGARKGRARAGSGKADSGKQKPGVGKARSGAKGTESGDKASAQGRRGAHPTGAEGRKASATGESAGARAGAKGQGADESSKAAGHSGGQGPGELEAFEAGEVVVTGTRTERRVKDVPVKTEVVPQKRIEAKGAVNLAQALKGEVGIKVDNQCSLCNTTSVRLSGMPGRYTLLLIDGIPMFSSLGTTYGFVFMDAADVKRLEIVKGAASVLYGTDAMGGVINVITQEPSRRGKAELRVEGGMYGYYNLAGRTSIRRGRLGLSLVASHTGEDKIDADGDGISEFAAYTRTAAAMSARYKFPCGAKLMFRLAGLQEQRQGGGLGGFLSVLDDWKPHAVPLVQSGRRALSESILTRRVESALKFRIKLPHHMWSESVASLVYHLQDSDYEGTVYRGKQYMAYVSQVVGWKAHRTYDLLGGVSYRVESLDENVAVGEYVYHMPGVFVQGDWKFAKWGEFVHGMRYDWHNEFGNVFTPKATFKFVPHRIVTIRAGVGTGFRAPTTFFEYEHGVRPQGYRILMDADKAETAVNANLSVTAAWKRWIKATVEQSFTQVRNPISVAVNDNGDMQVYNVEDPLYVWATELQLQSHPWRYLDLDVGYGFYHYEDKGGAMVSAPPVHQFTWTLTLDYRPSGTKAVVTGEVYSPMELRKVYGFGYAAKPGTRGTEYLDSANADTAHPMPERSPWWGVINVRVEQKLFRHFIVYLGVDNLLDYKQVDHQSPLFYPAAGPGAAPGPLNVVYIWGPLRGRFVYGGLKVKL